MIACRLSERSSRDRSRGWQGLQTVRQVLRFRVSISSRVLDDHSWSLKLTRWARRSLLRCKISYLKTLGHKSTYAGSLTEDLALESIPEWLKQLTVLPVAPVPVGPWYLVSLRLMR